MDIKFDKWRPFKEIYTSDENAKTRGAKFKPKNDVITNRVPGIYLIADSRVGSLSSPESLIYIGKTVGKKRLSSFHERLWKHCSKAIGKCGGKYSFQNDKSQRDATDKTEPQDTEDWSRYRHNQFKDFSTWYFSFYCLDESNFELAKEKMSHIENITMYAYSYYSTLHQPLCNSQPPGKTVKFPWM